MTHYVNLASALGFLILWLLVKRVFFFTMLVCPLLTCLAFYYFAMVDYDGSTASIYYTTIVGITSSLFLLIVFSEQWFISTLTYAPLLTYYMWKTGKDMVGQEMNELVIRSIFCVFLYAIVAYRVEMLAKQGFLGS